MEVWSPPTFSAGKTPEVVPGTSGGQEIDGDFPLDQIVIDQLPPGTQVHSSDRYGASAWTVTARISTTLADGEVKFYFLKCAEDEQGKAMLQGEFQSMLELYNAAPNFVPKPITWGKLNVSTPDTYYFLCEFIEMTNQNPDPIQLCTKLVQLHQTSISPTGKFGFHVNTCQGNLPQQTGWKSSWVDFYIQLVEGAMQLNRERNGTWKNLEQYVNRLITHVVPKVLGPLEADGRVVKPCLIHGDLWDGNIGTDFETGEIYIFDASAYYAHNEMEIAMWRGKFNKIVSSKVYLNTYLSRMGISEPAEQFDDRHRIYSCYMLLHESACHLGSSFREECYENLEYLINKYAPFPDKGSEVPVTESGLANGESKMAEVEPVLRQEEPAPPVEECKLFNGKPEVAVESLELHSEESKLTLEKSQLPYEKFETYDEDSKATFGEPDLPSEESKFTIDKTKLPHENSGMHDDESKATFERPELPREESTLAVEQSEALCEEPRLPMGGSHLSGEGFKMQSPESGPPKEESQPPEEESRTLIERSEMPVKGLDMANSVTPLVESIKL